MFRSCSRIVNSFMKNQVKQTRLLSMKKTEINSNAKITKPEVIKTEKLSELFLALHINVAGDHKGSEASHRLIGVFERKEDAEKAILKQKTKIFEEDFFEEDAEYWEDRIEEDRIEAEKYGDKCDKYDFFLKEKDGKLKLKEGFMENKSANDFWDRYLNYDQWAVEGHTFFVLQLPKPFKSGEVPNAISKRRNLDYWDYRGSYRNEKNSTNH